MNQSKHDEEFGHMKNPSKFWEIVFLAGIVYFLSGVLNLAISVHYNFESTIDPIRSTTNGILIFGILIGFVLSIFGFVKRRKITGFKGVLGIIGYAFFFIVLVLGILAIINSQSNCTEAKDQFERNSEQASEKYGYETFEQYKANPNTCLPSHIP
jgi:amino acid transporter